MTEWKGFGEWREKRISGFADEVFPLGAQQVPEWVKQAAAKGDHEAVLRYLRAMSSLDELIAFKRFKILPKLAAAGKLEDVYEPYLQCVSRFSGLDLGREEAYADFVLITSLVLKQTSTWISEQGEQLRTYGSIPFLNSFCEWLRGLTVDEQKRILKERAPLLGEGIVEQVVNNTTSLHEINARLSDLLHAGSRVLKNLLPYLDADSDAWSEQVPLFKRAMTTANAQEAALYLIDQVSFGEFEVERVDWGEGLVTLTAPDKLLLVARESGIRNAVSRYVRGRPNRSLMSETLDRLVYDVAFSVKPVVEEALGCYIQGRKLRSRIKQILGEFDGRDDLLIEAGDDSIAVAYAVGACLRTVALLWELGGQSSREGYVSVFEIVKDLIFEPFYQYMTRSEVLKAFQLFVSTVGENSFDVAEKPYLSLPSLDLIAGITLFATSNSWRLTIRRAIHGGLVGKEVGAAFEEYVCGLLSSYSWRILGRGVKLSDASGPVTDIDVFAVRNGLVLLIQAKDIPECRSPYEHWRARETVLQGIKCESAH